MYQKALTLTPDFAEAYGNLGIAFIASGNNMKAEQSLNKAMKLFEVQGKTKEAEDVRLLRQNFASKNVE
jgi:Flp pilus assembly protein TadD